MGPEEWKKIQSAPPGIITDVEHYHPEFIRDQSHLVGGMDSISFPRTEDDVRDQLVRMRKAGTPVTVQGIRTGLTGGAVPQGGHAMNMGRMGKILGLRQEAGGDDFFLVLQPGVLMREQIWKAAATKEFDTAGWSDESMKALKAFRAAGPYLFAPDPSEPTVAVGGMAANNSWGARSYRYGPTRRHVERVRVVLADGSALDLRRGREKARGRAVSVCTDAGRAIEGEVPTYEMPQVKNATGYFAADDMDLVDLFVGSEGTLGVFSEVEVRLIRAPGEMAGVMAFLPTEEATVRFARDREAAGAHLAAVEYFDAPSVELMRRREDVFAGLQLGNEIPPSPVSAVYLEYHCADRTSADAAVAAAAKAVDAHGGRAGQMWVGRGADDIADFKQIKHMLPEVVSGMVAERQREEPRIRKLGTDLAVPGDRLEEMLAVHHRDLEPSGLEFYVFGHLGDSNVHVNIVARDFHEYETGRAMLLSWARSAVSMGGTVSAEHGIGKVKKPLLREMYAAESIDQMIELKRAFDPDCLLNRGNIFDAPA